MTLVAGVDSSTSATKVLLVDAQTGHIVDSGTAGHPEGTECPPEAWWQALQKAGAGLLDRAEAVAVSGQQHGMVALDETGEVIRPALLWNDTRSAPQAQRLIASGGGPRAWAEATGSVPTASFTVTKLAWLAEHEPENAARTSAVMLPHDWLTMRLRGVGHAEATTDRSDASGTGYWSPATGEYLRDRLVDALGHDVAVPRVAAPNEIVGRTPSGAAVAAGTGDNAGAALGLGLDTGDVVVSLGTSGTVYGVAETAAADPTRQVAGPAADPSGQVAGFADATGRFLPLVCTLNAARVLETVRNLLNVDHAEFDALALSAASGAAGLTLLPYLDGERTPNRPNATGVLSGLTTATTRADLARAAVEGMLSALADGIAALSAHGLRAQRVLLIGGASASEAVRRMAPGVFGVDVDVPPSAEYVALGAARQAAWALSGRADPPQWDIGGTVRHHHESAIFASEQYARLRDETASWTLHRLASKGPDPMTDKYTPVPEDKFSFGIWTVGWAAADVFGPATRAPMPADRAVRKLAEIGAYGVNFHDNDVFDFDDSAADRDAKIAAFRKALDETGLKVTTATTNLFSHPVFKDGGFTHNDRDVRRFAIAKVMRNLDLAAELGARVYVCWGGREGAESGGSKHIQSALERMKEAFDILGSYVTEQRYDLRFAIEPKPNEPRGNILLPTLGHALAFINELEQPDLVGINPEIGHEEMAGLDYAAGIRQAMWHGKLFHIDLNGQTGPRYDQDLRFGAGNVAGAFWTVDAVEEGIETGQYTGPIHFDFKPPRTEDDEGVWASAAACMRNYTILRDKVRAFRQDPQVREALEAARVDQLAVPTLADTETWADLRDLDIDVAGLAAKGMAFERLDQLALEHLYGVR